MYYQNVLCLLKIHIWLCVLINKESKNLGSRWTKSLMGGDEALARLCRIKIWAIKKNEDNHKPRDSTSNKHTNVKNFEKHNYGIYKKHKNVPFSLLNFKGCVSISTKLHLSWKYFMGYMWRHGRLTRRSCYGKGAHRADRQSWWMMNLGPYHMELMQ